jgi:hypothetical protein
MVSRGVEAQEIQEHFPIGVLHAAEHIQDN